MPKTKNSDTRYFIDIDLHSLKVICWDYDQKHSLNTGKSPSANVHRLFLTKGQNNMFIAARDVSQA